MRGVLTRRAMCMLRLCVCVFVCVCEREGGGMKEEGCSLFSSNNITQYHVSKTVNKFDKFS